MSTLEHSLRVQIAQEHRRKVRDPERIAELQRKRAAERIRESITKITETAPPLTVDERRELAALLLDEGGARAAA
jgi:hypothetical protein